MKTILRADSVHNYPQLIKRWRRIVASRHLRMQRLVEVEYPIYYLETRSPQPNRPWFYCSAGIHGDEPAGPEALIQWAESSKEIFKELNILIFPCLNPWGLANNRRSNAQGIDLNRTYQDDAIIQTAAHRRVLMNRKFHLALLLHEDFDARGVYIYEIPFSKKLSQKLNSLTDEPTFIAEQFLAAAARHIPPDPRRVVEGIKIHEGIIRKKLTKRFVQIFSSLAPEAYFLNFSLNSRSLTIETPSEFHIDQRVAAHVAVLQQAVRYCKVK